MSNTLVPGWLFEAWTLGGILGPGHHFLANWEEYYTVIRVGHTPAAIVLLHHWMLILLVIGNGEYIPWSGAIETPEEDGIERGPSLW